MIEWLGALASSAGQIVALAWLSLAQGLDALIRRPHIDGPW